MSSDQPFGFDVYVRAQLDPTKVERAFARAFDLGVGQARSAPYASEVGMQIWKLPTTLVIVQPEEIVLPGDFPYEYQVTFKSGKPDQILERLGQLSVHLGEPLLFAIDVNPHSDLEYRLAAPDGSAFVVQLDSDAYDDDTLKLHAADRRRLDHAITRAHNMALAG